MHKDRIPIKAASIPRNVWLFCLVITLLVSCASEPPASSPAGFTPSLIPSSTLSVIKTLPPPTSTSAPASGRPIQLTVLYTNDEHGWMAGTAPGGGAANMLGLWEAKEGYTQGGPFLILSGGDNWTGPAISTWFDGQGMVEVMNAMGYQASAVGNHEFDFGLEVLKTRLGEAHFPFLAANLRYKKDGAVPTDLGIKAYTIIEVNGLKVGIIGLSTRSTPVVTNPANVADLSFNDYAKTLEETVPQVRVAGVDLILVTAHVCPDELNSLAVQVKSLGIAFFGGGHCEITLASKAGGAIVLAADSSLAGYGVVHFQVDPDTRQIVHEDYRLEENKGGAEDPTIAGIVARWQSKTDAELSDPIGYLKTPLRRGSEEMQALIVETWLLAYPTADVAISNPGGMRDDLSAGDLTLEKLIGILPFNDVLITVKLTGAQLTKVLAKANNPVIGGLHREVIQWVVNKTGQPLEEDRTYTVLVNDFMYGGGDNYTLLAQYDPKGYNTAIDWRQPIIDWVKAQHSDKDHPLDDAIAALGK